MSTKNRTPPLLEPYLGLPPQGTQLLLTGVLDATPTWLATRLLRSILESQPSSPLHHQHQEQQEQQEQGTKQEDVNVVLVSYLHDFEFWKAEARRGAGVDLARAMKQGRFVFVDGLGGLFGGGKAEGVSAPAGAPVSPQRGLPIRNTVTQTQRGGPLPSRGPVPTRDPAPAAPTQPQQAAQPTPTPNHHTLTNPDPKALLNTLIPLLTPSKPTHLILDSPTTLLSLLPTISPTTLTSTLLHLRSTFHSLTLLLETDTPFLSAASPYPAAPATALEANHAAFVVQQAHLAEWVVGLRPLDTGRARDVSGVVRVSRGGAFEEEEGEVEGETGKELEALYFVQGDGGVRVFGRGEGSVG